jgi:hypothetical protein
MRVRNSHRRTPKTGAGRKGSAPGCRCVARKGEGYQVQGGQRRRPEEKDLG